jgi:hypothetical protein
MTAIMATPGASTAGTRAHWDYDRDGSENCPHGWICWWSNDSFDGERCSIDASFYAGQGWRNMAQIFESPESGFCNNMMNSWKNDSNLDAKWAHGSDGSGTVHCMDAGARRSSVSPDRDEMSSIRVFGSGQNPC